MRNPIERRFRSYLLHRYGDTVTRTLAAELERILHKTDNDDDKQPDHDREEGGHPSSGPHPSQTTTPRSSCFLSPAAWGDS